MCGPLAWLLASILRRGKELAHRTGSSGCQQCDVRQRIIVEPTKESITTVGCRHAGSYLFSDEMYRGMEFDPATRLRAAVDVYERGVSLCGMSKAVGGPGLRIGWLATHATEGGKLATLKKLITGRKERKSLLICQQQGVAHEMF